MAKIGLTSIEFRNLLIVLAIFNYLEKNKNRQVLLF